MCCRCSMGIALWLGWIVAWSLFGGFDPLIYRGTLEDRMTVFHSDLRSLLIPGIVDQAIGVGNFLPIIDLVARNASLKDQVRIAPNRVKRIILYRCQSLNSTCQVGWREVVGCEETACLFTGNMQRHK